MENKITISFSGKEISELNLSGNPGKEISVSINLSSKKETAISLFSDSDWIEVPANPVKTAAETSEAKITIKPPAEFEKLTGKIAIKDLHGSTLEELTVNVVPRPQAAQKKPNPAPQANEAEFRCSKCNRKIPVKRPYCSDCRRNIELEKKEKEETESVAPVTKTKDFIKKNKLVIISVIIIIILIPLFAGLKNKADKEGFGDLEITSEPAGAEVISLDNSFKNGKTPLKIKNLPCGVYKFSVHMDNCANENEIIGVEVKKSAVVTYNAVLQKKGTLQVDSLPQGALILIDNVTYEKKTPATLENIDVGDRKVTIIFDDEIKREAAIPVKWGEQTNAFILKDKQSAGLELKTPDDIKVYADGNYIGKTPLPVLLLAPGKHTLSFSSPTILPWKTEITVEAGNVATLKPVFNYLGVLEIKAPRRADLYVDDKLMGALPLKIYCSPNKKVVAEVIAHDGASWKMGFMLKEGEYRLVNAKLPPPPVVIPEYAAAAVSQPPAPFTDFSQFRLESRFPPSQWQKVEEFMNDIDLDGESEMILGFKNRQDMGANGYKISLFIIKKHDGSFFDVIPLRNPRLGCIGEGELISLDVIRSDAYGYREIVYSCGTASKGVTEKGAFVIYKGRAYTPQWTKGSQ